MIKDLSWTYLSIVNSYDDDNDDEFLKIIWIAIHHPKLLLLIYEVLDFNENT